MTSMLSSGVVFTYPGSAEEQQDAPPRIIDANRKGVNGARGYPIYSKVKLPPPPPLPSTTVTPGNVTDYEAEEAALEKTKFSTNSSPPMTRRDYKSSGHHVPLET